MSTKDKYYSIGQFAEMGNASIKQLRYLEEKGILKPKMRNRDNNYRYYTHDQLNQLVIIKTLRNLGVSFEDVVSILQSEDLEHFSGVMRKHLYEAEQAVKTAMRTYEQLSHYYMQLLTGSRISRENIPTANISLVRVPPCKVAYTRYHVQVTAWELFIDRFFELQRICEKKNLQVTGGMCAIFHDGYLRQFHGATNDLETLFPISVDVFPTQGIREYGGFDAVSAVHMGHYKDMEALYLGMQEWAAQNGHALSGCSVEKYIIGPDMALDPANYVTQLFIPLAGSRV